MVYPCLCGTKVLNPYERDVRNGKKEILPICLYSHLRWQKIYAQTANIGFATPIYLCTSKTKKQ